MTIDASALQYARRLLHTGYGYQNAARCAGVSETSLRAYCGAPSPRPSPSPWMDTRRPRRETPRAQRPDLLCGPSLQIVREVANKYHMTPEDLISGRRTRPFAFARHEAMYRIKTERARSLPAIGRLLGGRDHTTVLHGIRCHEVRAAWAEVMIALATEFYADEGRLAA